MNELNNRVFSSIIFSYDFWYSVYVFSRFKVIACYKVRASIRHRNFQRNNIILGIPVDAPVNNEPKEFIICET